MSVAAVGAVVAGAVAAGTFGGGGASRRPAPPPVPVTGNHPARLVAYGSCDQFLRAVKAQALAEVGPYGLPSDGGYRGPVMGVNGAVRSATAGAGSSPPESFAGAPAASATPASSAAAPAYSTTNDQVAGADEPDTVKTDGRILVVLRRNPVGLQVASVAGPDPGLQGFLPLAEAGSPTGILLSGNLAVVLSDYQPPESPQWPAGVSTRASVVDLADPAHPHVVRSFDMSGTEAGVRLVAGRVVMVLRGGPHLQFGYPAFSTGGSAPAVAAATQRNREVIERSTLADWLPTVTAHPSGVTTTAGCAQVLQAPGQPGTATVSVLSIDPASDQPGPETTVLGGAETVYASTRSLYVATSTPGTGRVAGGAAAGPAVGGVSVGGVPMGAATSTPGTGPTDISGFDLSDPTHIRYTGSAQVPGQLLGQYAMSSYNGNLRVATTVGQPTPAPGEGAVPYQPSDSRITILTPRRGSLVTVGSIHGLGVGERLYGVRFVGPLAYVVTFRQTDPLYVVDLADPAHPTLEGQLALTGFSTTLQPLSGSLLLGVGQSVDANLRQTGLQLSVFDVSDPAAPALRSRTDVGQGYSAAQTDPHALLWWPAGRLVAMPVTDWRAGPPALAVWRVGAAGSLTQVAELTDPGYPPGAPAGGGAPDLYQRIPQRAVVVGNLLYTVSGGGIMATDMTSWHRAAWLPFT